MYKLDILRNSRIHSFGDFDLDGWGGRDIVLNDNIFNYDFLILQESHDNNRHLYITDSIWLLTNKSIGDRLFTNQHKSVIINNNNIIFSDDENTRLVGVYGIKL